MSAIFAVLASALAYGALFPPFGITALSFVALVPLAGALRGQAPGRAALLGAVWAYAATLCVIAWLVPTLNGHFAWSLSGSIGFLLGFGLFAAGPYFAVSCAGIALAGRVCGPWLQPFVFASGWVAAELARTELGFQSPWTRLGDSHAGTPWIRQIADLGGVYAVSFVVALVNGALVEAGAALRSRDRAAAVRVAVTSGAVFAAAATYGGVASSPAVGEDRLRVLLVQGNLAAELRWQRSSAGRVLRRYGGLTRDALRGEASVDLIVWPENAVQTPLDDPTYGPPLRRMATSAPLLLGAPRSELVEGERKHFNSALFLRPGGSVAHYDKRRLLPFSETRPLGALWALQPRGDLDAAVYTPGQGPGVFEAGDVPFAVLICMEALYPELALEAARDDAQLLVNLSNDGWYRGRGGAAQHLAQARFRAVETGLPLVRVTTTGISAVIAPDGRIVDRIEEGRSEARIVTVPAARLVTPVYVRIGDTFAWACTAGWLAVALVGRRRSRIHRTDA